MSESTEPTSDEQDPGSEQAGPKKPNMIGRIIFLVITVVCFVYLYYRINGAAAREGLDILTYMGNVFANVDWISWLVLMVSYSIIYFLIDTWIVSRTLSWFITDIKYKDILPIRASAYIISIFNEQVGKGAMAYYLNKRHQVPGWEVGSVMLFIMFCEVAYLLFWAALGYFFSGEDLPPAFSLVPYIAIGGAIFLVIWIAYFRGKILPNNQLKDKALLHAFRQARPWHYLAFLLMRSPALIAAIVVYAFALNLFGVEASIWSIWPYLPVIFFAAAVPTPMRAAAITIWVLLFPDNEGQMAAFGFVQHNFFILFNAAIGLIFLRRTQRDLFG